MRTVSFAGSCGGYAVTVILERYSFYSFAVIHTVVVLGWLCYGKMKR